VLDLVFVLVSCAFFPVFARSELCCSSAPFLVAGFLCPPVFSCRWDFRLPVGRLVFAVRVLIQRPWLRISRTGLCLPRWFTISFLSPAADSWLNLFLPLSRPVFPLDLRAAGSRPLVLQSWLLVLFFGSELLGSARRPRELLDLAGWVLASCSAAPALK
jgi:hypothetical protein